MYHIYPEQMIFTKLFTPRKRDYGDLDKCLNCVRDGCIYWGIYSLYVRDRYIFGDTFVLGYI